MQMVGRRGRLDLPNSTLANRLPRRSVMPQQELCMKLVAVFTEISFSAGLVSKNPRADGLRSGHGHVRCRPMAAVRPFSRSISAVRVCSPTLVNPVVGAGGRFFAVG